MERDYIYKHPDGSQVRVPESKASKMHALLTSKGMTVVKNPDGDKKDPPKRLNNKESYSITAYQTGKRLPDLRKNRR